MFYKEKYMEQVKEINRFSNISERDFDLLYRAAQGESIEEDPKALVERIVLSMFKNQYSSEILIPWNFFATPVGEAIAAVRFGRAEEVYLIHELAELMGYSVQYIHKEVKNGNLKGEQRGKVWLFKESSVNDYLTKKGRPQIQKLKEEKSNYEISNT